MSAGADVVKGLFDRGKCLLGMHQGRWTFDRSGACAQTRVCTVCGVTSTQFEHAWAEWTPHLRERCLLVRRCTRCAAIEDRVSHAWSPWVYSDEHHAPVRTCTGCGTRMSRFDRQTLESDDAADEPRPGVAAVSASSEAADGTPPHAGSDDSVGPTAAEIVHLFTAGDTASRIAFAQACAEGPLKAQALEAMASGYPEVQYLALCALADRDCRGASPERGVAITEAVYTLAQQGFDETGAVNHLHTAAQAAVTWLVGLSALGRHDEMARVSAAASAWLTARGHTTMEATLLLWQIEACLSLDRLEEAGALIERAEALGLPKDQPALHVRLADQKKTFRARARQRATDLPETPPDDAEVFARQRDELASQIAQLQALADGYDSPDVQRMVASLVEDAGRPAPDSPKAWAAGSQQIRTQLTEFLSGGAGGMTQLRNRNRAVEATMIFNVEATAHDPAAIDASLATLLEAREWARENDCTDDESFALWGLYLCYSRTDRPAEAIEVLYALRRNLEQRRAGVADPMLRAGAMRDYPYLFPALCRLLCEAGRPADLLEAMEGAKGRVLADVLTSARGQAVPDAHFAGPLSDLTRVLAKSRAHYASYFVDDDDTYVAVVTKDGAASGHRVPLGRTRLRALVGAIDPAGWGRTRAGLFGAGSAPPFPSAASELLACLEPLLDAGRIDPGDHLCFCPDDLLHLVPFHYLPLRGRPLVTHVTVSRIHSAAALVALLDSPNEPPSEFVAVTVPAQQDLANPEKVTAMARASGWLGEHLSGTVLARERATFEALARLDLAGRVVHFATHGTFPVTGQAGRNPNPFHASGLALASGGALPSLARVAAGEADATLLTPERVLGLDLTGSHVTLQACVSGLSKEGIGGDALGLELALLLVGATSVLSTHWNIPASESTDFAVRFYRRWLLERASRADAWREAMLELMAEERPAGMAAEYYWAGFSLSGDWR